MQRDVDAREQRIGQLVIARAQEESWLEQTDGGEGHDAVLVDL